MMVADSDVLIDFLRAKAPKAKAPMGDRIKLELATGRLATTAINAFELLSGARSGAERERVSTLLAALVILPLLEDGAAAAAEVRRRLEQDGRGIGMADYLIAGICLANGATLLTRNLDHFERVPDLRIGGRWPV